MKRLSFLLGLIGAIGFFSAPAGAAEKKGEPKPRFVAAVDAERPDALYRRGESVTFVVQLRDEGTPVEAGEIEWALTKDGVGPARTGRAPIRRGRATVTGTLDEAGFLQCRVTYQAGETKVTALGGAGVSPLEIKPSTPAPRFPDTSRGRSARSRGACRRFSRCTGRA